MAEGRTAMTWLVRQGTERGEGSYITRTTETLDARALPPWLLWAPQQWAARRFELRDLAEDCARDYGGRVVRLTKPERLWLVRLGKKRGRGAYVHYSVNRIAGKIATTRAQSLALRMTIRAVAVRRAADCGGRVVRLMRKR